jgi:glycosyltransferase involved in cell wall biosynthesis
MDFTIVIPTYNGASHLPRVLEKLKLQNNLELITGEIIVIDNNSNDHTAQVIKDYQANWSLSFPLRYCFEPQQGLSFARQRGVEETQGELIGFLDDDNLPNCDWIITAYNFGQQYLQAGAFSGKILGEFEVNPPDNFEKIAQFLAIRDNGTKPCLFEPEKLRLPPGAGLVVRRKAWIESVPKKCILSGPKGNIRVSGSDYEILLHIYKQGWQIWYNPQMCINHYIPRQRLERNYLLSLAKGIGLSTCQYRMMITKDSEKPFILLRTILGNLRRIVHHLLKYHLSLQDDMGAAFELAFFWGGFLGPFYYLRSLTNSQFSD